MLRVAVIGAGAAGCFCAAEVLGRMPHARVTLFERAGRPMGKLAVTGGGRCNLSNTFAEIRALSQAYPRGERVMQRALKAFSPEDACRWFTARGVPVTVQPDQCIFPRSQDAMDVVHCLEKALHGAELRLGHPVRDIRKEGNLFSVDGEPFDRVVVTSGGTPQGLPFLQALDIALVPPVPSLFTFNIPDPALRALMGLVVPATLSIPGTAFRATGPLLLTDWGFSGPATLRLSSYAARYLAEKQYRAPLSVNWMNRAETEVRALLQEVLAAHPQQQLRTVRTGLPARLWACLVQRAGLREDIRCSEVGSKGLNRLTATLTADNCRIEGKCKFREEFVTAGGVALEEIRLNTLESKRWKGLYFAGEVLDVDAVTGGFNLQAAWSTAYVVAQNLCL